MVFWDARDQFGCPPMLERERRCSVGEGGEETRLRSIWLRSFNLTRIAGADNHPTSGSICKNFSIFGSQ
jgi:hypothetical protein